MGVCPPTNEFNISATPSQQLLLRLKEIALSGNEVLHSQFSAMADAGGRTERGRAAREKERNVEAARTMQATQERIAAFQRKLDDIERASYEALMASEDRLREAQKKLDDIRNRAYEISMPDGTIAKVYRDGDKVRDDDGHEVSREIIRAEDLPESSPNFQAQAEARKSVQIEREAHEKIREYRQRAAEAQQELDFGVDPADAETGLAAKVDQDIPADIKARMSKEFLAEDIADLPPSLTPRRDASMRGPM